TSGSGTAKTFSADSVRSISRGAGDVTRPMLPRRTEIVNHTKRGETTRHEHSGPWAAGASPVDGALHGPVRADDAAGRVEGGHRRTPQRARGLQPPAGGRQ